MDWTSHQKNMIVNGRRFSYVDIGEGEDAVLLLHGLAGSWRWWSDNLAALSESRRVIAVDLPGFGDSEVADSQDIDSVVDCLEAFCAELGLGAVDVVGHSWGTLLASQLAERFPQRVRRMTFTGGPLVTVVSLYRSPLSTLRRRPVVVNFLIEVLTASIPLPALFQRVIVRSKILRWLALSPFVASPGSLRPEIAATIIAGAGSPGVIPTLRSGFSHQGELELPNISHPTLIIAGRKDRIAPVRDLDEFANHEAVRRVVVLDDCGHCPMLEHPDTFNREQLAFLD